MADNSGQMVFWTAVSSLAAIGTLAYTAMRAPESSQPVQGNSAPREAATPGSPTQDVAPPTTPAPTPRQSPQQPSGYEATTVEGTHNPALSATQIATTYWTAWSGSDDEALSTLDRLYAEEIDFFGRARSHGYVMQEKARMVRHWPRREYVVDTESLQSACQPDGYCSVSGTFRWKSWGRDGVLDTAGTFRFGFGVRDGMIVREFGSSMSRE